MRKVAMHPVDWLLERARRNDDAGRALKRRLQAILRWSAPPNRFHRLLLAERTVRRLAIDELCRALYYQPIFSVLCHKVEDFHLELCPDSKVPAVDNCLVELGSGVRLSARSTFSGARNAPERPRIAIGEHTYVGHRVVLRAGLGLTIGRHCYLASNVFVSGDPGHPLDPVARRTQAAPLEDLGTIEIGDDVWIAEGAAILGNVRIGHGAVVAARSVVTHDVPPFALVAGTPARVVRTIGAQEAAVPVNEVVAPAGIAAAAAESAS